MKYTTVALCCLLALASANVLKSDLHKRWEDFKKEHGISYSNEVEHEFRFRIFGDNLRKIIQHNREYREGKQTYKVAVNRYADMLHSEFLDKMTGTFVPREMKAEPQLTSSVKKAVPESMDWREKGAVTPMKDQGQCGSCWAFSTTGSLEGANFLKTGKMVRLSEQNLMDCSTSYGNHGCNGGLMDLAFEYIKDNGGVDTEESYPYEERDATCRFNPDNVGVTITGYKDIPSKDEDALQEAVGTVGPVSVAINAGQDGFRFYSEGVYTDSGCRGGRFSLNHGVLAVGYGSENGEDYWLVKNSWGTSWGAQGYIKMARNKNNQCGIATQASYPLL